MCARVQPRRLQFRSCKYCDALSTQYRQMWGRGMAGEGGEPASGEYSQSEKIRGCRCGGKCKYLRTPAPACAHVWACSVCRVYSRVPRSTTHDIMRVCSYFGTRLKTTPMKTTTNKKKHAGSGISHRQGEVTPSRPGGRLRISSRVFYEEWNDKTQQHTRPGRVGLSDRAGRQS